jgi:histone deacetylase HOS3
MARASKPEPGHKQSTKQSSRRSSLISNTGSVQMSNGHTRTTIIPARPGSSQSIRPDSSLSTRGRSIPIVKKTRTVAQPRPGSKTSVKKSPNDTTHSADGAQDTLSASKISKEADIDALTTGMKKIKINLVTKAQREAREKKLAPKPAPEAMELSQNPKSGKKPLQVSPTLTEQPNTSSEIELPPQAQRVPTPQRLLPSRFAHLQDAANIPLPFSSPLVVHNSSASNGAVFIPYQPEGPTPAPVQQQEPLKWLPPNTSTPTPKTGDLPVFTSTGSIPFGPIPSGEEQPTEQEKPEQSIWDVPETPDR